MMRRTALLSLALIGVWTACASSSSSGDAPSPDSSGSAPPPRTLVAVIHTEPKMIAAVGPGLSSSVGLGLSKRMFNADLARLDDRGNPQPYLAATLPQLDTDSWVVNPDGTMVTTYTLKPDVTWHDGSPLTADDFVFAWRVYAIPELGVSSTPPLNVIQDVAAPDERTVVIRWTQPFATAGALQSTGATDVHGLPPLPRAILGPTLEAGSGNALFNHPYWTTAFVGLGPYRLDQWVPGAYIEASAFERHVLGAPKIPHIKLVFMPDANAALASMLAGDVQFAGDSALPTSLAAALVRQAPEGTIGVVQQSSTWRAAHFQARPDFVTPAGLQDPLVRRALAFAVDKRGIDDVVYEGQYILADSMFSPATALGQAVDAATTKYPLDLRQSVQLMADAGFTKGSDGVYVSSSGGRFAAQVRSNGGTDNEAEMSALASGWRQAGFDFDDAVLPAVQAQDPQARSTFPGVYVYSSNQGETGGIGVLVSTNVPRPENGWRGISWDGYSSGEMDRLSAAFTTAMAAPDRTKSAVDIVRLYSTELPSISLFFPTTPWAFSSDVSGPREVAPQSNVAWNIEEWAFR